MLLVRHARPTERFLVMGCLSCWERPRLPEPHHELMFNIIQPTPHFLLLVRYQPAEGTASGGIGCDVRHHDRDRAAARSKRFVFVLCCLASARSCCGTDDDGASLPLPPSFLRRLLSLDLLRCLRARARDAARRNALGGGDRDLDRDQGHERHLPELEPVVPVPADGARDHSHGHDRGRHLPAPDVAPRRARRCGVTRRVAASCITRGGDDTIMTTTTTTNNRRSATGDRRPAIDGGGGGSSGAGDGRRGGGGLGLWFVVEFFL